jgi:hypothetical protein
MSCVVNQNPGTATASLEALLEEVIALRTVAVQRAAARLEQDALRVLGNILSRMEARQHKKAARLRALHW